MSNASHNQPAVGFAWHRMMLEHRTGNAHPDQPERLLAIRSELEASHMLERLTPVDILPATPSELTLVHEPAYIHLVQLMCEEEMPFIGSNETHISRESYEAARWAAGCGIHACRSIMAGTIDSAFCAVRPPGHHALTNRAMGFCIFNNAAIAAEYLVREYDLERIAIIDWDIHHGNGTQDYFFERNDVFYISIHQDPAVSFPGTGEPAEIGIDHGRHYTLNIALPPGSREDLYRRSFDEKIVPALEIFRPQFVIISAGFDACKEESIAFGNLPPQAFHWMTAQMVEIARNHAEGRLLSILEGGYHIPSLRRAVASHIQALLLEPVS